MQWLAPRRRDEGPGRQSSQRHWSPTGPSEGVLPPAGPRRTGPRLTEVQRAHPQGDYEAEGDEKPSRSSLALCVHGKAARCWHLWPLTLCSRRLAWLASHPQPYQKGTARPPPARDRPPREALYYGFSGGPGLNSADVSTHAPAPGTSTLLGIRTMRLR